MTGDDFDYAADRLLEGAPAGPPALARLLAAASAPGRASELAGEEAALSAYRLVRDAAPAAAPSRTIAHHRRRSVFPKRASVRLLVAGGALMAVAAAGGVAVAAGVVPGPLRILAPADPSAKSSDHTPGHTAGGPSGSTTGGPTGSENGQGDSATNRSPDPSSANINGLCHAFQDAAAENLPAALHNPRFAVLVTLAGGESEVQAYCVKIIDDKNQPAQHDGRSTPSPSASVTGQ